MVQTAKNLPAVWEICIWSLGWEDPLEKGMATHPSILAWRIPWTWEPARLVYGVTKGQIQPSDFHFTFITENSLQEMLRKKVLFSLYNLKNTVIKWGKKDFIVDGKSWIHTDYNNKGHGHQHVLFFPTSKFVCLSESTNAYKQVTYLCPQNSRNLILIVQNLERRLMFCSVK